MSTVEKLRELWRWRWVSIGTQVDGVVGQEGEQNHG